MFTSPRLDRWPIFSLLEDSFKADICFAVVFGGTGHEAIMQTYDMELYAVGANASACLGIGEDASCMEPRKISELCGKKLKDMAFGAGPHVLACTEDGAVYSWGHNGYCQVGNGNPCIALSPMRVSCNLDDKKVLKVACGSYFSLALTEDGEVYAWGQNSCGQIGSGGTSNQTVPRKVSACIGGKVIVDITCSHTCSLAVTNSGQVYGWGYNGNGQLGLGNTTNQTNPTRVAAFNDIIIKKVVAGSTHTLALTDTGEIYSWGGNQYGQLGTSNKTNFMSPHKVNIQNNHRIVDIAAINFSHMSAAISGLGKVYIWGQCRGQSILQPMETKFACVDDVFAMFSGPPVTCRPLKPEAVCSDNLLTSLQRAFNDEETADIRFHVEGKDIFAHKAILKIRCGYFRSMFRKDSWTESSQNVIEITNHSFTVYKAFLYYLYADVLMLELTKDEIVCLLDLSNECCEWQLKSLCASALQQMISLDNVATLYNVGIKYDTKELAEFALSFAFHHMTAVTATQAFNDLDNATLKKMIKDVASLGAFRH